MCQCWGWIRPARQSKAPFSSGRCWIQGVLGGIACVELLVAKPLDGVEQSGQCLIQWTVLCVVRGLLHKMQYTASGGQMLLVGRKCKVAKCSFSLSLPRHPLGFPGFARLKTPWSPLTSPSRTSGHNSQPYRNRNSSHAEMSGPAGLQG